MWLFALFDLPVETPEHRRIYVRFRKVLLEQGFSMLQYSVYARYLPSEEASDAYRSRIKHELPSEGQVRLIAITDRQFGKMEIFNGESRVQPESAPQQLLLL